MKCEVREICGEVITLDEEEIYHYCPHCGAKMDGERKDEE